MARVPALGERREEVPTPGRARHHFGGHEAATGQRRHGVEPGVIGGHHTPAPGHAPVATRAGDVEELDRLAPTVLHREQLQRAVRALREMDAVWAEQGRRRTGTRQVTPDGLRTIGVAPAEELPALLGVEHEQASPPGVSPSMAPNSLTRIASPPGSATRSSGFWKPQMGFADPTGSHPVMAST